MVTSVLSDSYSAATREGFRRLFSYLQGANAAGSQIAMTAPVAVRVAPNGNYTVAFYAAPPAGADSSEADPPEPTAPDVALVRMPEVTAYALSYGGWATDATVRAKAGQLLEALASDGEPFSTRAYISAEYGASAAAVGATPPRTSALRGRALRRRRAVQAAVAPQRGARLQARRGRAAFRARRRRDCAAVSPHSPSLCSVSCITRTEQQSCTTLPCIRVTASGPKMVCAAARDSDHLQNTTVTAWSAAPSACWASAAGYPRRRDLSAQKGAGIAAGAAPSSQKRRARGRALLLLLTAEATPRTPMLRRRHRLQYTHHRSHRPRQAQVVARLALATPQRQRRQGTAARGQTSQLLDAVTALTEGLAMLP